MLYKNGSVLCNYSTVTVGELADIGNFVACWYPKLHNQNFENPLYSSLYNVSQIMVLI